jgi:DNA invertase Pin-like site-specific DNA recombinase
MKLDRLGRSVSHLVRVVDELERRDVALRSLSEQIDTSTSAGRFMVHMLAALAQMEADLIRERTLDGLAAARSRGRVGGRPTVMSPERLATAQASVASGQSVAAVARALGGSVSTVRRHLAGHVWTSSTPLNYCSESPGIRTSRARTPTSELVRVIARV